MINEMIEDLLIEFDELGFDPTTLTFNPELTAKKWKEKLIYLLNKQKEEINDEVEKSHRSDFVRLTNTICELEKENGNLKKQLDEKCDRCIKKDKADGAKELIKRLKELAPFDEVKTVFGSTKIYHIGEGLLDESLKDYEEDK